MKQSVILIFTLQLFALYHFRIYGKSFGIVRDPDIFRNVSTLITSKGYPLEEHTVQTADGYLLSVQRIPYGRKNNLLGSKRRVVYLQHGWLSSSAAWVLNFPKQSLGFILADAGYDVWMGNTRGNAYSNRHLVHSTDEKEFWEFSFDEMARYDLPAMIDYILKVTGEEKLYCIGHSQGSTSLFALLSDSPTYNEKIRLLVALAPVTTIGDMKLPVRFLAPFTDIIEPMLYNMKIYDVLPKDKLKQMLSLVFCQSSARFVCEDILFLFSGSSTHKQNATRLGVYTAHLLSGASTKSLAHFGQLVNSKQFGKYDYGGKGNMDHYNQSTPPEYDLSRITTPVALIWSTNDKVSSAKDVARLQSKLKSVVFNHQVDFNHMNFLTALDASTLVYDPILFLLAEY